MNILYIYRHPDMGFSIGRVFKPIEQEMANFADKVDSVYMPVANYSIKGLWKNISAARKSIKEGNYDVVHITGAEYYLIPFIKGLGAKVVVTVHDLGFYTNFRHEISLRHLQKNLLFIRTLKFADIVTCISEKTRKEVCEVAHVSKDKTTVIADPYDNAFVHCPKEINAKRPRILHVGGDKPNKNLARTIEALKGRECHLRIIGKISNALENQIKDYSIDYSIAFNLTDEEIVSEYQDCDIVSFPSLYEGFGMPIIEGQATGRPVLTSDREPMSIVAGESAVLVDPEDVESIRNGYTKLLDNANMYVEKGLQNSQLYQCSTITKLYANAYRTIEK